MDATSRTLGPPSNRVSEDVVFELKPKEGGASKSHNSMVDKTLFTGENKLHAVMDKQTSLWYLKYERGVLPQAFQQRWTSYPKLKQFVENYYDNRNVEIVKTID